MTFEGLCDRLVSLFDVSQTRAVDIANERLSSMVGQAKSLKKLVTIGTTTADLHTYALAAAIVDVERVTIAFTTGSVIYTGTESLDALLDIVAGLATDPSDGHYYAVEPDTDDTQNTSNLYVHPAPTEAGRTITGRCAVLPATLTYTSATALPIALDLHRHLLAGCRAEILDEDSRQDESAKLEAVFESGVRKLEAREKARGTGSDRHRMRVVGYDLQAG